MAPSDSSQRLVDEEVDFGPVVLHVPLFFMYHSNTGGSAASNITFSSLNSLMNGTGSSVRYSDTCSVTPSDPTGTTAWPACPPTPGH